MRPLTQYFLFMVLLCRGVQAGEAAGGGKATVPSDVPARLLEAPTRNPLPNPGFEKARGGKPTEWQSSAARVVSVPQPVVEGRHSCELTVPTDRSDAAMYTAAVVPLQKGARYEVSLWAKGNGALKLGYSTLDQPPGKQKRFEKTMQPEALLLSDDWQQAVFAFSPERSGIKIWLELSGDEAVAYLDEAHLVKTDEPDTVIRIVPGHPLAVAGGELTLDIRVTDQGQRLTDGELKILLEDPAGAGAELDRTIGNGYVIPGRVLSEPGLYRALAVHPGTGASEGFYIDAMRGLDFKAMEEAGERTTLKPMPAHILVLGDSLTDFDRGRNWVDKMSAQLLAKYGSRVTVKNGAVGGDFITRVWTRLHTESGGYKGERYDGLLEQRPTHVFIFLGHNDSKVSSASGYTEPQVPLEEFEQDYRNTIAWLKEATGAQIVIVSSVSCDYTVTQASADRAKAAGRRHNLFGVPEVMEQFNAVAQRVAADTGCGYLDLYTPTRDHPDKASLFDHSGVHLSNDGHRFLALQVLSFLGRDR